MSRSIDSDAIDPYLKSLEDEEKKRLPLIGYGLLIRQAEKDMPIGITTLTDMYGQQVEAHFYNGYVLKLSPHQLVAYVQGETGIEMVVFPELFIRHATH